MSVKSIVQALKNHCQNLGGWRTNRKIVVFESDDWGAIRSPDISVYKKYCEIFGDGPTNPYFKYDCLASETDLEGLFNVLVQYKDRKGSHPLFTFNTIVANPDFEKIRAADFHEYYYEPFTATLEKYSAHGRSFGLWQQAIREKLMQPQLHGREHLNVLLWLEMLRAGDRELREAFDMGTWSVPADWHRRVKLQAALDYEGAAPSAFHEKYIREAQALFEALFGFRSISFIPPNFIMDLDLLPVLRAEGIGCLQGMKYYQLPRGKSGPGKRMLICRRTGFDSHRDIWNLARNVHFEPSQSPRGHDDVGFCLSAIANAFFHGKPAVVNTHRLNYIGTLNPGNRERGLRLLEELLRGILQRWPEVEFMGSAELVGVMGGNDGVTE